MLNQDILLFLTGFIFVIFIMIYMTYILNLMKNEDFNLWLEIGNFSVLRNNNLENIPLFWGAVFNPSRIKNRKVKKHLNILKYFTLIYIIYFISVIIFIG